MDFGKPKHPYISLSFVAKILEHGKENWSGQLVNMIKDARFSSVSIVDRYKYDMVFIEARK